MRTMALLLAALLTIALTAGAAVAETQASRPFGSCRAQGGFAICIASGTTHHPLVIRVHVAATPNQRVFVSWDMVCSKGLGAGSKQGQFRARTPVNRIIPHPYRRPGSCTVAAAGQLNRRGHIHVWLTATHW